MTTLGAALALGLGLAATLSAREPELASGTRPTLTESLVQPVARFYSAWGVRVLYLAAFVLLFKLPDQLATNITTPKATKGA